MMSLWHQGFVRKSRVCPVMVSIGKWNRNTIQPILAEFFEKYLENAVLKKWIIDMTHGAEKAFTNHGLDVSCNTYCAKQLMNLLNWALYRSPDISKQVVTDTAEARIAAPDDDGVQEVLMSSDTGAQNVWQQMCRDEPILTFRAEVKAEQFQPYTIPWCQVRFGACPWWVYGSTDHKIPGCQEWQDVVEMCYEPQRMWSCPSRKCTAWQGCEALCEV